MHPDITVGSPFPDYELPDQTDTMRQLSVLQGDDPMVLVLSRGYYCPKDRNFRAVSLEIARAMGLRVAEVTAKVSS